MTPNNFWIASVEVGAGLMVRLSGELDMAGAEVVRRFAETDLNKEYGEVRFDCRGVTFIDSIGVKALLHLVRRCAEMGVEPQFRMSARVERVLAAMGLGSLSDLAVKLAG
jgi:anti-anti-sigma factor